ncbi:MAG TPA: MarR family transcriptional regulator [Stellaceae bacterium]|nr:MarR family transcriptional regulator [Stellaceae bacterium]
MAVVRRGTAASGAAMRAPRRAAALKLGRLGNHIGYAVRIAQLAVFEDVNALLAPQGATTARFSTLCLVRDNPGVNQTVLADALRTETSRMVLLIDELERRGWLVRLASTMDRRARAIYLTAEGRRKLKILKRLVARHERAMIRRLRGGDKAVLLRLLRNLAKSL